MPNIYYNKKDKNTIALLHFDDPNDVAKDECGNIWEKVTTSLTCDTSTKKFGTGSFYNSAITSIDTFPVGGSDFTIDFWAKAGTSTNCVYASLCLDKNTCAKNNFNVNTTLNTSKGLGIDYWRADGSGVRGAASGAVMSTTEFQHVAAVYVYSNSKALLFHNGVLIKTVTDISVPRGNYYCTFLGQMGANAIRSVPSSTYIDEFRISNCARWTENFTPPTAPYSGEHIETKSIEFWEVK